MISDTMLNASAQQPAMPASRARERSVRLLRSEWGMAVVLLTGIALTHSLRVRRGGSYVYLP